MEHVLANRNTSTQMMEFSVLSPPLSFERYERLVSFDMECDELNDFVRQLLKDASFDEVMKRASFYKNKGSGVNKGIGTDKDTAVQWLSAAFELYKERNKYLRVHASIRDIARSV